ncbi:MAG: putative porin [Prevotella sp.]|nr:putative porin [Prevotella sp.]
MSNGLHKRITALLLMMSAAVLSAYPQVYNEMDVDGNITQIDERSGTSASFNPNRRDSTKGSKTIPYGVRVWHIDRQFGDIIPAEVDTMPHLYQNSIYSTGVFGQYNTLGSNYTARQSRIFIDRKDVSEFFFTDAYDYTTKQPDEFLFVNTLSPYTNISYDNCGDKQNGEDHIDAKFAVNANKRLGFGFDLDYHYARGYFQNQNNAQFRASLFASYVGSRYQMHALFSSYHRKMAESGGITNDEYILHPESFEDQYSEEEIPSVLSKNWNRNNSTHFFLTHRYNVGFYRKVKMTDEEIKARQFAEASARKQKEKEEAQKQGGADGGSIRSGRGDEPVQPAAPSGRPANARIVGNEPGAPEQPAPPVADSTRVSVESPEAMDSLLAISHRKDSLEANMKREYVPVTSFIHTLDINKYDRIYQAYLSPTDYYANSYYNLDNGNAYSGDSIYDQTRYLSVKNTFGIALLEGFNKYMKAGLKVFASHEYRRYQMPALATDDATAYYMEKWTGHCLNIGGQMAKTQGRTLHFNLAAELGLTGMDAGSLAVNFTTDLNFKLLGDTVRLAANAWFHRSTPTFFQDSYHSKHMWWDQSLESETRTHLEGMFTYDKTDTRLRVAIDEIQNYTYFGMSYTVDDNFMRKGLTGGVYQASGNINVLTAQLMQNVRYGIINWENVVTFQNSSNSDVLPLPALNIFTNLYLKFKIARVLNVELGGCATYFTPYKAPDYLPQIGQYAVQQNSDSRVEIGGYPYVDVYANMHLKRARFFIAMSHVNAGTGSKKYFLTPHYPTNSRVMHLGVSWNFYN